MILTDYYLLENLPEQTSVHRRDCTISTHSYPDFESLRNKKDELFMYLGDVPDRFKGNMKRKAGKALSKRTNITSLYVPDITKSVAYGDIKGTNDALIAAYDTEYNFIELMIARGQKNNAMPLYNLYTDGELLDEVENLKNTAHNEGD